LADEGLSAVTTEIVPFSGVELMKTVLISGVVGFAPVPVPPWEALVALSRVPWYVGSSPVVFSSFVVSSDPAMPHHTTDDSARPVVLNDGQTSTLSLAHSLGIIPSLCPAEIFVIVPVAFFAEAGRNSSARSLVRKQSLSTRTSADCVIPDSSTRVAARTFASVGVTRMRFDTCSLVCRQFKSSRTATDCIFPNCAACVTAWTLSFVLVARMRWSFGTVLDLIAVSDGEVEERRFAVSRGFLIEKSVGAPGATCESFVPHSKLAEVADEPLTRLKATVLSILFLTQHPSRSAGHSVRATIRLKVQFAINVHGIDSAFTAEREAIILTLLDCLGKVGFRFELMSLTCPHAPKAD